MDMSLRIPFVRDMKLRHSEIGLRCFEGK